MNLRRLVDQQLMRLVPVDGCYGVYDDFEHASSAAPAPNRVGYDAANAESWYRDRLDRVIADDYPMLFWFEKTLADSRRVVEIGGHVGVAFHSFSKLLKLPDDLSWTVVDVPSVTREGERLARERNAQRLRFANALPDASTAIDVLIASGSLQYVPGPLLPERVRAMNAWPRHIIIHKTPIIEGSGYVTLQCIGRAWCPYRIHGYGELIRPFLDMGYELIDNWAKNRQLNIPRHPELRVDEYRGYYLRRR